MNKILLPFPAALILFLTASLLITACKKKDENKPKDEDKVLTDCDLKAVKNDKGNIIWKYTYDAADARKVVKAQSISNFGVATKSYKLSYNGAQVLKVEEYDGDFETLTVVDSFFYNGNGTVAKQTQSYNNSGTLFPYQYINFYYDANSNLEKLEKKVTATNVLAFTNEYFYDANSQVIKIIYTNHESNLTNTKEYILSSLTYRSYDVFENIYHANAYKFAPVTEIELYGAVKDTSRYALTGNKANYVVKQRELNSTGDTLPYREFEYQCF